jgi:uncharacterized repeat protein (TIGR03837 family)
MNRSNPAQTPEKINREQLGQWDIFCQVIDNFGDIGVSWRLASDLAARGQQVRLWTDDSSALAWMAPDGCVGIKVLPWFLALDAIRAELHANPCGHLVETFGCDAAPSFLQACAEIAESSGAQPVWVNLEYLSAEGYVERCHALPSPVQGGPAKGWRKHFFYPGFTPATGGLLRETDLLSRQIGFDRKVWLKDQGVEREDEVIVSLFCYEPPALVALLRQLSVQGLQDRPVRLLVTAGRSTQAVRLAIQEINTNLSTDHRKLSITWLPLLTQRDFDHLLWSADLNFVRGEDSLVRALWAGKPLIWQIYPQDDGAQHDKLEAFLNLLDAPPALRVLHQRWNQDNTTQCGPQEIEINMSSWAQTLHKARAALLAQIDLTSALTEFTAKNR